MDFAPAYLAQRFFYRIFNFFHHWYVDGSRAIARRFMGTISSVDQTLALKITIRHFFEPLYKDYSIVGRILGIVFRTGRVAIGMVAYAFIAAAFIVVYLVWLSIPLMTVYFAAKFY